MSGGSWDYLCFKEGSDIFDSGCIESLEGISDRIAGLGYAEDAAKETEHLVLTIRQAKNRISAMKERLNPLFRAIEWWDSCDSSEDGFKEALEKYRQG